MKNIATLGALAFVVFYAVTAPADAAGTLHTAVGWLGDIGHGLSNFVTKVS